MCFIDSNGDRAIARRRDPIVGQHTREFIQTDKVDRTIEFLCVASKVASQKRFNEWKTASWRTARSRGCSIGSFSFTSKHWMIQEMDEEHDIEPVICETVGVH